nr:aldehyde dehydrogenase family 2 member C4 [Tanacetum cinerariifolium]
MVLMELLQDLIPAGVVNVVNGFGLEAGKPLASSPRINKASFTGETTTGRLIMQYAAENLIPFEKILSYLEIGKAEGAEVLMGGEAYSQEDGALGEGYYIQPTMFRGHNKMRIFQEEIFGPVVSVTTFKTVEEAIEIANDTLYG